MKKNKRGNRNVYYEEEEDEEVVISPSCPENTVVQEDEKDIDLDQKLRILQKKEETMNMIEAIEKRLQDKKKKDSYPQRIMRSPEEMQSRQGLFLSTNFVMISLCFVLKHTHTHTF